MPNEILDLSETTPLQIETVKPLEIKETKAIEPPAYNVFDPNRQDWQKSKAITSRNSTGNKATNVLGIVRLRGINGVLTSQGFISIGNPINGGVLVEVSDGKYIIETEGQRETFSINSNIEKIRRRFKEMGLPFLN